MSTNLLSKNCKVAVTNHEITCVAGADACPKPSGTGRGIFNETCLCKKRTVHIFIKDGKEINSIIEIITASSNTEIEELIKQKLSEVGSFK